MKSSARTRATLVALSLAGALTGCSVPAQWAAAPGTDQTSSPAPASTPGPSSTPAATAATTASSPAAPAAPAPVVVLDPGHNGGNAAAAGQIARPVPAGGFTKPCNTTGTQTDAGYPEHAFTLDVAQRTAELLRARGVTVVLTRTDDTGVGPCVDERAAIADRAGAAVSVSVHADGAAAGARGFHVIEPGLAPDHGNAAVLDLSAAAAEQLRSAFAAATGQPEATYPGGLVEPGMTRRTDLAGLNLAQVPSVFIECGNMRNAQDAAEVTDPAWRQRAAQGIADGITGFLATR